MTIFKNLSLFLGIFAVLTLGHGLFAMQSQTVTPASPKTFELTVENEAQSPIYYTRLIAEKTKTKPTSGLWSFFSGQRDYQETEYKPLGEIKIYSPGAKTTETLNLSDYPGDSKYYIYYDTDKSKLSDNANFDSSGLQKKELTTYAGAQNILRLQPQVVAAEIQKLKKEAAALEELPTDIKQRIRELNEQRSKIYLESYDEYTGDWYGTEEQKRNTQQKIDALAKQIKELEQPTRASLQQQQAPIQKAVSELEKVSAAKFTFSIKNGADEPMYVRGVKAKIAEGIVANVIGNKEYQWLTDQYQIDPGQELKIELYRVAQDQYPFRYIYWHTEPIDDMKKYTGYFELPQIFKKESKKAKIRPGNTKVLLKAKEIIEKQKHTNPAEVTSGDPVGIPLMESEINALNARGQKTNQSINGIVGNNYKNLPRIGLCFSGGGLRAMFSSLGFAQGLERTGILDTTSYVAGLSGSTWFLMKWLKEGDKKTLENIRQELVESMLEGLEPEEVVHEIKTEMIKKALEQITLGRVYTPAELFRAQLAATKICNDGKCSEFPRYHVLDLWAYSLAKRVFKDKDKYTFTLSSLENATQKGHIPLPIFTSIHTEDDKAYGNSLALWEKSGGKIEEQPPRDYQWFEITPFSASFLAAQKGSTARKSRIPTWALGRKFESGNSVKEPTSNFKPFIYTEITPETFYRPEPSAAQLIGAFGSAFSPTLAEVANIDPSAGALVGVMGEVGTAGLAQVSGRTQEDWKKRYMEWLQPTNLAKGLYLYDFAKGGDNQVELRDGGIFYNLPLPPLFNPQRNLDIIIVNDASGDLHEKMGKELQKFATYSKGNSYYGNKLPHDLIDDSEFNNKINELKGGALMAVFNDPRKQDFNQNEVTIIYAPTIKSAISDIYLTSGKSPTETYDTFKLQYEPKESEELLNYNDGLAQAIAPEINGIIKARTEKMNQMQ